MSDIFLSYSRDDQATARRFADALEAQGFDVWWDADLRSGESYDEVTEQALRDAKAVIVLWSKRSVTSRWVRAEATLADRNRTLVPAMIEICERPIMFELTQTADLSHWDGDVADKTWQAFLADVRQFAGVGGRTPAPRPQSPSAPLPAKVRGGRPSLAVLPFANRSGERADDIFAMGMVEDIIAALCTSRGVKVIAQSATVVYRKNVSDLKTIGRELGARYILEGNVRRVGADLRVTVQLVEAETAAILWSQKFDRPLAELAWLQEELVTELAAHLGVQITRIEMEKALRKPGDLTAWEAVMRAWAAYARYGVESLALALAEARNAVALAPDYAVAHGTLCMALGLGFQYGGGIEEAMREEAFRHVDRALALDANNATVLYQVSNCLCMTGRGPEALAYAERSVELNPNIPSGRQALAQAYIAAGRPDDALAQLDAEAIIAPRGFTTYLALGYRATALYLKGDLQESLRVAEQSLVLSPTTPHAWGHKCHVLVKLGRPAEAFEAFRRARALEPDVSLEVVEGRYRYVALPRDAADDILATYRAMLAKLEAETAAATARSGGT